MKKERFLQILRFMVGGGMALIVYYSTLYFLTEYLHIWYLASSIAGWFIGHLVGFSIHKFWTFKNKNTDTASKQFMLFITMAIIVLISNTTLLYIFVEYIKLEYIIAQLLITFIFSIVRFFITRKIFETN